MAGLWIATTLIASAAQTARNAAQAGLTRAIGTVGATQVRFLFGLPFAVIFLALVTWATGEAIPLPTPSSLGFATMGALAQIGATALMLMTMKSRGFAITTAWIKTEPVIVALTAALVLGDPLHLPALVAIVVATVGVVVMTLKPGAGAAMWHDGGPAALGLLSGALFGVSAIGFRGGIVGLPSGGFLMRATSTLVLSLAIQTTVLLIWMGLFNRPALRASFSVWRSSLWAGFLGAFASQFWFIGFSLTTAANVRTLALVEVIFAQVVARRVLGQRATPRQLLGMGIIVAGVVLLLQTQA